MRMSILSAWSSTSELPLEDGGLPGPEAVESYPLSYGDAVSSSVERADLFRNGAVGGVLGLLGLVGRLKRVRLEGCSLRWYVW